MSMPKIECNHIDKCCAAASLVQSIALEETAKSRPCGLLDKKSRLPLNYLSGSPLPRPYQ